jgi:hypothetical protein
MAWPGTTFALGWMPPAAGRKRGLALSRASLAVLGRAPVTVQLIHTMELSPIQRRQPHAAISTGNRAPVMKETASDMV